MFAPLTIESKTGLLIRARLVDTVCWAIDLGIKSMIKLGVSLQHVQAAFKLDADREVCNLRPWILKNVRPKESKLIEAIMRNRSMIETS